MPAPPLPDVPEGTVLGGKFVVHRELGKGGMGVVYEVTHRLTGHRRALKVLRVESDDIAKRTLREASAAGLVNNPHVADTYDAGYLPDGRVYILMEMLEGQTLGQLVRQRGGLPVALAAKLVAQVCDGLHAAHEVGIVHRDVKPANIFVLAKPGEVRAKLLDFGVSKFDTSLTEVTSFTEAGKLIGTPMYMAPEQMRAAPIDGKADMFSMANVLYFAFTGQRPFPSRVLAELAVAIDRGQYVPLDQIRPDVPESVVALVHRGLAVDPVTRPSARELRDALLAVAGNAAPVSLWPEPVSELGAFSQESAPLSMRRQQDTPQIPSSLLPDPHRSEALSAVTGSVVSGPEPETASGSVALAHGQPAPAPAPRTRQPLLWAGLLAAAVLVGAAALRFLTAPSASTPTASPPPAAAPQPPTPAPAPIPSAAPVSPFLPAAASSSRSSPTPSKPSSTKPKSAPGALDRGNPYK